MRAVFPAQVVLVESGCRSRLSSVIERELATADQRPKQNLGTGASIR